LALFLQATLLITPLKSRSTLTKSINNFSHLRLKGQEIRRAAHELSSKEIRELLEIDERRISFEIFKTADKIIKTSPTILEENELAQKLEESIQARKIILSPINLEILKKIPKKWQAVLNERKQELLKADNNNKLNSSMNNQIFFHTAEDLFKTDRNFKLNFMNSHTAFKESSKITDLLDHTNFNCTEYLPSILAVVQNAKWDLLGQEDCDGFAPKGGVVFSKESTKSANVFDHERFHSTREQLILPLLHELGLEKHIDDTVEDNYTGNVSLSSVWNRFQNELIAYLYGSDAMREIPFHFVNPVHQIKFPDEICESHDNYTFRCAIGVPKEKLIEIASIAKDFKDSEKLLELYAPLNSKENLDKFISYLEKWAKLSFVNRAYESDSKMSPHKIYTFFKKLTPENQEYFISKLNSEMLKVLKENALESRPQIIFNNNTEDNFKPIFKVVVPELINFFETIESRTTNTELKLKAAEYKREMETSRNIDLFLDKFSIGKTKNLITRYIHLKLQQESIPEYKHFGDEENMASLANPENQRTIEDFLKNSAPKIEELARLCEKTENLPSWIAQSEGKLDFGIGSSQHWDSFFDQTMNHFNQIIDAWINISDSKRQNIINDFPKEFKDFMYQGPNPLKHISEQLNLSTHH
jgi:hypothetical protein